MLLPWQTGKVIRIEDETQTTRRFWIELNSGKPFDFKPGQFVTLDLPIHEKPNKRWRSYSIASWPDGSAVFELLIVLMEGGMGTNYLFNEVRLGSELIFRGPLGLFTLPDSIEKDLFLICTGTGIAPFRSMIHHILNHNIVHQDIHLIFGCRRLTDSLYQKEMEDLQERVPRFQYIPVFSREVPENREHLIRTGYVHSVYEEICRRNTPPVLSDLPSSINIKPAQFYLCGWKNMIDEAKLRILALGYDKKAIHLELYG
ncbi:MAG: FAD-binding oxidoreductase [Bacteroidota bacterium]|nr:FAD-binding oxidoreductase [Bacteroidota bacterium]